MRREIFWGEGVLGGGGLPRREMASKVLRAVVLGPPGSGKGTVCERIARSFGLQHLSSGQFLRESLGRGGGECPGCPPGLGAVWGWGRGRPRLGAKP